MYKSIRGNWGFGFKKDKDGLFIIPYERNPHEYNVMIGEGCEIDPMAHICQGSWRNTVIGDGTMVDGLVHIAHNVIIGKNCLLESGASIGGSAEIGDRCELSPLCCIQSHVKVTNNVTIGTCANVTKDITEPNSTWVGNPARLIHHYQAHFDKPMAKTKVIGKTITYSPTTAKQND